MPLLVVPQRKRRRARHIFDVLDTHGRGVLDPTQLRLDELASSLPPAPTPLPPTPLSPSDVVAMRALDRALNGALGLVRCRSRGSRRTLCRR